MIGRERVDALAQLPTACLAATVDPVTPEPPAGPAAPHYTDIAEVSPELYDAAVIAVPHDRAVELASVVLKAGRPLLIEKPLGIIASHARRLEKLASALASPSFVGYNYRFLPNIRGLIEIVCSGQLGRLRNVDLLLGHGGNPMSDEGWKLDPVRAGGGVLLDPGVHLLDLLLTIAPGIECTDIQATRGFWRTGIEEDVVAVFRSDQLLATVRVSHIRWVNTFRVEIVGEDGYALAEGRGGNYGPMGLRTGRRWAWNEPGATSQSATEDTRDFGSDDVSLREELARILEAWRSDTAASDLIHPATMAEGRAVTELCEELYERLA
jgi:predicted dehydrogenase